MHFFFSPPVIVLWTKAGEHLLEDEEAMRKVHDRLNKVGGKNVWNKG